MRKARINEYFKNLGAWHVVQMEGNSDARNVGLFTTNIAHAFKAQF
jgi:hypothetical protein